MGLKNNYGNLKIGNLFGFWLLKYKTIYNPNGRKEGNVLFNDALNTFYLRLYGVGHMVKQERKHASATWVTLFDYQQGFFYMHHPTDRIAHTTTFVTAN